jgi:hypothetical protein
MKKVRMKGANLRNIGDGQSLKAEVVHKLCALVDKVVFHSRIE